MNADEAMAVTAAYQAAMVRIGAEAIIEALRLYQRLNPARLDRTAGAWLEDAVALALSQHRVANYLGTAYYRLYRALMTGYTMASPDDPRKQVSLGDLRDDFADLVAGLPGDVAYAPVRRDDGTWVPVDPEAVETPAQAALREREAQEQARLLLKVLGIDNLTKNLDKLDPDALTGRELDEARNAVLDTTASRQSSAVETVAMNGARRTTSNAIANDPRALGWVRVSTTGSPCGFCAMLISRPYDMKYGTKAAAKGKTSRAQSVRERRAEEGDPYHLNCHCISVAVYSESLFNTHEQFKLNRELDKMWQHAEFTIYDHDIPPNPNSEQYWKGFRRAWDRHFRNLQRASR